MTPLFQRFSFLIFQLLLEVLLIAGSSHQHLKASLRKMMVGSQCLFNAALPHHDKGGAICQRPFLVQTPGRQLAAVVKQFATGRVFRVAKWFSIR